MAIPKSYPMKFVPKGLADAYDSTEKFPGACRSLKDLIFDHSNPELVISRPGVTTYSSFTGFSSPGFVSVFAVIGTRIYGMLATTRNAGHDEPFCFDTISGLFITISGVTSGNTPTSPLTTGPWTPPTIANIGTMIVITHPGFNGSGVNFFGVIDITTFASPAWTSANLVTNALSAVPVAVANFNNRAYFAVANAPTSQPNQLVYSDVLTNPLTRTNATQQLVVGDDAAITALSGLPVTTTSSGIVGTMMVFKADQIWQVTGDTATSNLALTYLSLTVGTSAPRSVVQSPIGLYFAGSTLPYFIDLLGTVRPVGHTLGDIDPDVQLPFLNTTQTTRMSAWYSGSIYRICIPTLVSGTLGSFDYWFDERRRRWTGPHSFAYDCASDIGNNFMLSSSANPGKLIFSQSAQTGSSVFTDLGVSQMPSLLSATFPKPGRMTEKQVVESTQELSASGTSVNYQITAQDEQGNTLGSLFVLVVPGGGLWGTAIWGNFLWSSNFTIPHVYSLPWADPLVFKKMALYITATTASASVQIGAHYSRYQDTGYTNLTSANTP